MNPKQRYLAAPNFSLYHVITQFPDPGGGALRALYGPNFGAPDGLVAPKFRQYVTSGLSPPPLRTRLEQLPQKWATEAAGSTYPQKWQTNSNAGRTPQLAVPR